MVLEMQIPSPGESISEVEIAQWLVSDGDYVKKDQIIAEIDSDKATLELPAEQSGIIKLKVNEGDVVEVGQVVCNIDTSVKEELKKSSDEKINISETTNNNEENIKNSLQSNSKSEILSPAARKLVAEKNIDIDSLVGSGKSGRITKQDVLVGKPAMGNVDSFGEPKQNKIVNAKKKSF